MHCPICYHDYTLKDLDEEGKNARSSHVPKVLHCGHTLCSQCAEKWASRNTRNAARSERLPPPTPVRIFEPETASHAPVPVSAWSRILRRTFLEAEWEIPEPASPSQARGSADQLPRMQCPVCRKEGEYCAATNYALLELLREGSKTTATKADSEGKKKRKRRSESSDRRSLPRSRSVRGGGGSDPSGSGETIETRRVYRRTTPEPVRAARRIDAMSRFVAMCAERGECMNVMPA